jgi:PTH1 family peptidyl-tRNA hydrolase
MKLIVGLGNPGREYTKNRHNIGFMVIDELISRLGASSISKTSFKGELYKAGDTLLLKPQTYMNLSGESVQAVYHFYDIELDNIVVIHDDLDLAFGAIRVKKGGGHGGHNGLRSIDKHITPGFYKTILIDAHRRWTDMPSFHGFIIPRTTSCINLIAYGMVAMFVH